MFTRRTFVKSAVCAATISVPSLRAFAPAPAPLTIGICTSSYVGLSLDEMISQLKTLLPMNGLNNQQVAFARKGFAVADHPTDEAIASMHATLSDSGIRCVSYSAGMLRSEKDLQDALKIARTLGAKTLTSEVEDVALLKTIDQSVSDAGMQFGLHNQIKGSFTTTDAILKALDGLSASCGVTADSGNFAAAGLDPVDAIRKLEGHIKIVRLKDVKAVGSEENSMLGEGIAKIIDVEAELHRQNFRRMVAVEYVHDGDPIEAMQKNVGFAWQYGFSGA